MQATPCNAFLSSTEGTARRMLSTTTTTTTASEVGVFQFVLTQPLSSVSYDTPKHSLSISCSDNRTIYKMKLKLLGRPTKDPKYYRVFEGGRGERFASDGRTGGRTDESAVSAVFMEIIEDGIFKKSDKVDQSVEEDEQKLWKCYPRKSRKERKDLKRLSGWHGTRRLVYSLEETKMDDRDGRSPKKCWMVRKITV